MTDETINNALLGQKVQPQLCKGEGAGEEGFDERFGKTSKLVHHLAILCSTFHASLEYGS